jgi:hypothetical protein
LPDQFRTTVSAVFWTATPEEGQAEADAMNAVLPEGDQAGTIVTIEYVAAGKPEPTPPPPQAEPES